MADYVVESIHDLLMSDSESISDFVSSQGSYHPSRECFMADIIDDPHHEVIPKGLVMSANNSAPYGGNGTPPHPVDGCGAAVDTEVPPYQHMD
jgi:hypothetical protein